ncbi:MAG: phosphate ABC transporter ATP-binding protein [Synechococcaceae cyanobacterium SM2_3_1]|nr:phosphate ABC transporter ATP-binding protein [Synechococcaceae cyanobacterium SM2_3_1]
MRHTPPMPPILSIENAHLYYGKTCALRAVSLTIPPNQIMAFIGPSGCGKSTLLRSFNRLNDLISGFRLLGQIRFQGQDLYAPDVDPVEVRRHIGMVFQKPTPFPKSIFDNVAYGARVTDYRGDLKQLVEQSLRRAALWEEVKDQLHSSGLSLSGGQQQRLCIARTIATEPEVVLMDEPCSALDPISTAKVEELILNLKQKYTLVVVTHNMQQAQRVADRTAFFNVEPSSSGGKVGYLVEVGETRRIFENPTQEMTRNYVTGRWG